MEEKKLYEVDCWHLYVHQNSGNSEFPFLIIVETWEKYLIGRKPSVRITW